MKKNPLAVVVIVIVAISAFLLLSRGSAPKISGTNLEPQAAAITLAFGKDAPRYDFGTVSMTKGKVARDFTIANESDKAILIRKAMTSCMCTEATLMLANGETKGPFGMPGHGIVPEINVNIPPSEALTARVVFDPAAHGPAGIGNVERDVLLETDGGEYIFGFTAQVTP
ncbi:MAG: DUF1573 domain-containing protein [Patescibacteria group bacterium]